MMDFENMLERTAFDKGSRLRQSLAHKLKRTTELTPSELDLVVGGVSADKPVNAARLCPVCLTEGEVALLNGQLTCVCSGCGSRWAVSPTD